MEITYEQALNGLRKLAAERPDYVHSEDPKTLETRMLNNRSFSNSCYYRQHDDTPGCIVGALVADLYPDVRLREGNWASLSIDLAGISLSTKTEHLLDTAQENQDAGEPWAKAVALAEEAVARNKY